MQADTHVTHTYENKSRDATLPSQYMMEVFKAQSDILFIIFKIFTQRYVFIDLRKREKGGEERHRKTETEKHPSAVSRTCPKQRSNLQPR